MKNVIYVIKFLDYLTVYDSNNGNSNTYFDVKWQNYTSNVKEFLGKVKYKLNNSDSILFNLNILDELLPLIEGKINFVFNKNNENSINKIVDKAKGKYKNENLHNYFYIECKKDNTQSVERKLEALKFKTTQSTFDKNPISFYYKKADENLAVRKSSLNLCSNIDPRTSNQQFFQDFNIPNLPQGFNTKIALIERGWGQHSLYNYFNVNDRIFYPRNANEISNIVDNGYILHGSCTLGILASRLDRKTGFRGILPTENNDTFRLYQDKPVEPLGLANAIFAAIEDLNPNDVMLILIELSTNQGGGLPIEQENLYYTLIKIATRILEINVIEPAGNGSFNLDNEPIAVPMQIILADDYDEAQQNQLVVVPNYIEDNTVEQGNEALIMTATTTQLQNQRSEDISNIISGNQDTGAIMVSSIYDNNNINNSGDRIDTRAHTGTVRTTYVTKVRGGWYQDYTNFCGTCCSATIIAGIVALLSNSGKSNQEIRNLLKQKNIENEQLMANGSNRGFIDIDTIVNNVVLG